MSMDVTRSGRAIELKNWCAANSKCFHANEEFRAQPFSSPPHLIAQLSHYWSTYWWCSDTNFRQMKNKNNSFEYVLPLKISVSSFPSSLDSPTNYQFPLYCQKKIELEKYGKNGCAHTENWQRGSVKWKEYTKHNLSQRPYNYLVKSEIAHIVFLIILSQHSFIFRNCLPVNRWMEWVFGVCRVCKSFKVKTMDIGKGHKENAG